jgi:hypothetical protein
MVNAKKAVAAVSSMLELAETAPNDASLLEGVRI